MTYKKYIKRGGKVYGPYIYESKRVNGKVVSNYKGKKDLVGVSKKFFLLFALSAILIFGIIFVSNFSLSGKSVFELNPVYQKGEIISGKFNLVMRQGEMIPKNSVIKIKLNNQSAEIPVSRLVSMQETNGNYYLEDNSLFGEGGGYGVLGSKKSHPTIFFSFLVKSVSDETDETPEEKTETLQEIPEQNPEEIPEEQPAEQLEETSAEEPAFGIGMTGEAVLETETRIDGEVSFNSPYEYQTQNGDEIEIIEDSIHTDDKTLSSNELIIGQTGSLLKITTEYYEEEIGFGYEYLGDEAEAIEINLADFGIIAEDGNLEASLVYENQTILEKTETITTEISETEEEIPENESEEEFGIGNITEGIEIETNSSLNLTEENLTLTNITEINLTELNITEINITEENFTIQNLTEETIQYSAVINQPVRWKKVVSSSEETNMAIQLPKEAVNISVRKIENSEISAEISGFSITGNAIRNLFGRLTGRAVEENLTSEINFSIIEPEENINLIDNIADNLTEQVNLTDSIARSEEASRTVEQPAEIPAEPEEEFEKNENIILELNESAKEVEVEYYTDAPQAYEEEKSYGKEIVVSGPDNLNYTNILAYTFLEREVSGEKSIKLYWIVNGSKEETEFNAYDTDNNSLIDYVGWVVPHLSNQSYELVLITKAVHLDSNKTFIADVYDYVKSLDGNWTSVGDGEYLRVTFEKNLTKENDITIYARGNNSAIEIYTEDNSSLIARFDNILEEDYYKVYLNNLNGSHKTFDLRVLGQVDFDYVVDPWVSGAFSLDPMIVWGQQTLTHVNYTFWNGTTYSKYGDIMDQSAARYPYYMEAAASPQPGKEEAVVMFPDSTGITSSKVHVAVWNGTEWIGNKTFGNTTWVAGSNPYYYKGFDVEYINNTHAIAVWDSKLNGNVTYSVWDGIEWGPELSPSIDFTGSKYPLQIEIDCYHQNSECALITITGTAAAAAPVYGAIFNGTTNWRNTTILTGAVDSRTYNYAQDADVEYNILGDAVFMTGELDAKTIRYAYWNGTTKTWSSLQTAISTNIGGYPYSLELSSSPVSTDMAVVVEDSTNDIHTSYFNGTGWSAEQEIEITASSNYHYMDVATVFNSSGIAFVGWGNTTNSYTLSWNGTNWSNLAPAVDASGSQLVYNIQLVASKDSGEMIMLTSDAVYDAYAQIWSGTAWGNATTLETAIPRIRRDFAAVYFTRETLDTTNPEITILSPLDQNYSIRTVHFNVSTNENTSWCGFSLDNHVNISMQRFNESYFNFINFTMLDGSHNVTFSCNDTSNNVNTTSLRWFYINTTYLFDCGELNIENSSYKLYNNVSSNGTCFTITANNVTIDCMGFEINYSADGTLGYGVYSNLVNRTKIKNCKILEGSATTTYKYAVYFLSVYNGTVENNTVVTVGERGYGIHLKTNSDYGSLLSNRINTSGDIAPGIYLYDSSFGNITSNTVKTSGNLWGYGLILQEDSNYNYVSNNSIQTSGESGMGVNLITRSNSNVFRNNIVNISYATNSYGLFFNYDNINNTFYNLNITSKNQSLRVDDSSQNFTIFDSVLNSVADFDFYADADTRGQWNFTNVTFSDRYLDSTSNGVLNVHWYLDVYANYTNSTHAVGVNITGWNVTGITGFVFSELTNDSGSIARKSLLEYSVNSTKTIGYFNNYTLNASIIGFTNQSKSINMSTNRFVNFEFEVAANTAPETTIPTVSPVSPYTDNDITCTFTISDENAGDTLTANYTWYRNNAVNLTYIISVETGVENNVVLDYANTTRGENWSCGVMPYDGTDYGIWKNSTNASVINKPPTISILSPDENYQTTDRTPEFNYSGSDVDEDIFTFEVNISCYDGCSADNRIVVGLTGNYTVTDYLLYLIDNGYHYNWSVRSFDGSNYSGWSSARILNISSLVVLALPTPYNNTDFEYLKPGETKNTTTDSPAPLKLQNDGNCIINVSLNASQLFVRASQPIENFMYKFDNVSGEEGAFNWGQSNTTWTKFPAITGLTVALASFNWTDSADSAEVDLLVSVPADEPDGNRSSTINFIASLAE